MSDDNQKAIKWLPLILVLAFFAIVIAVIYFRGIMKSPWIHGSDTEETYATASPEPTQGEATEPPTPTYDPDATPAPGFSKQIAAMQLAEKADVIFLVVPASGSSKCDFYAFEKQGGAWPEIIATDCLVGVNGINNGDRTQDDGTTPHGIFKAGMCFGLDPAPSGMRLNYYVIDSDDYWDGDPESSTYNTLVKGSSKDGSWNREISEHLSDYAGAYDYCIDIGYNKDPVTPGAGFAIFLHCRRDDMVQTQGCVALDKADMEKCLRMATENTYFVILSSDKTIQTIEE